MEVNVVIELNGKLEPRGAQLAARFIGREARKAPSD
jgi:hypothetical protein